LSCPEVGAQPLLPGKGSRKKKKKDKEKEGSRLQSGQGRGCRVRKETCALSPSFRREKGKKSIITHPRVWEKEAQPYLKGRNQVSRYILERKEKKKTVSLSSRRKEGKPVSEKKGRHRILSGGRGGEPPRLCYEGESSLTGQKKMPATVSIVKRKKEREGASKQTRTELVVR